MRKICAFIGVLFLVLPLAFSDSATMTVTIGSSNPTVDNIVIEGQDTGASVNPSAGTTVTVDIEAEASDNNGYTDITSVICSITGPGTVQGSPVTLTAGTVIDSTTRTYTGSFAMDFYDAAGSYTVSCQATDSSAGTGSRQESFSYAQLIALELDASTIAFPGANPGAMTSVTGDASMATGTSPTIRNLGNVQIDADISGTDLSSGGNSIGVGSVEYQFGSLGWDALTSGTQTETALNLAPASSSTQSLSFRLTVPTGTQPGSYSGSTTVTATAG